ncbi:DUF3352 domain-containing protein [Chryseolinea lacunae]|uniref:DUF3352 domain-containing protein n=1 Tax=Chryseolinea lacunae TaxID=2801331 RepID=A0ABS1L2X7_9BACT|nr:DUF3352 domain-containing protein [Chryseolinea lacunae]MBL0745925.1 DUF3352 domain-containing protein [Chryseolinea lacunae]
MKRLPLLITIGVTLLLAGGYFLYDTFLRKPAPSSWDLVPTETILVYEGSPCETCVDQLTHSPVLNIINKAVLPSETDSLRKVTDFVLGHITPGSLVSLHVTKKDDFDFVFYIPATPTVDHEFNAMLDRLKKYKGAVDLSDHEYSGIRIYELSMKDRTFSWIKLDHVWVSSFAPMLIEDVIRTYNSDQNFKTNLGTIYQLPKVKSDGGNIYLNLKNFTQWFSLFTNDTPSAMVQQFGHSALLDVKINDNNDFVLNGFSVDSASHPNYILSSFSSQTPVPFTLKQYVSNRSLMFASYGISDGASFTRDLEAFTKKNTFIRDTLQQIARSLKVDVSKLRSNLSGELGVCWMESKGQTTSKILIINTKKGADEWMNAFNSLSQQLSVDTVFYEKYSDYEIRELPLYRFPEKIFWPLVSGFNTSYYTSLGNAIFIGEDLEELKLFLEDIDKEDTWGKSVAQNKFLESTLLESNVSLYVNTPRVWNVLENSLQPRWKKFIQQNKTLLKSLQMGAVQFSHLNDSYYTNVSWSYKKAPGGTAERPEAPVSTDKYITNFNHAVARAFVVKSHVNKSDEVLVQDSSRQVSLVSPEGKVLWALPVDGPISGDVLQVDYFNNGKLQYFFATPGMLHVVDRLGKYVQPFPVKIKERDIEFVSIVDYDHSKKYRFLVTGRSGNLWMFDKDGKNLEGWQPKSLGETLFASANHHRIRGKDYIVAIREDGNVYILNRRGEVQKGFPLNLNARPAGDYYLESGSSKDNTYFVVISRDGFRIKFTLDGKIHSRETLLKNTVDAQFRLVREKDFKDYLIVRQETKQLTVFDEDLKEIVVSDFIANSNTVINYLNFGGGKSYISVTDTGQELSFVYDGQGKFITTVPIESNFVAVRPLDFDKVLVFSALGRALTIKPL